MPNLGFPELIVVLLIVVVIFGANRLPGLGRGIGSAIKNFQDGIKEREDDERGPQSRIRRRATHPCAGDPLAIEVTPQRGARTCVSRRSAP